MTLLRVVDRDGVEHEVDGNAGFTLMENLRDLEYGVGAICGGMCACATCHVYVDPSWIGKLPRRSYEEQSMLQDHASFDPKTSRLSCQIVMREAFDGLRLTVAPDQS